MRTLASAFKHQEIYHISELPLDIQESLKQISENRTKAYAPYSNYSVGAVISDVDGNKFYGVNAETANYDGTCAEAGAIAAYVMSERKDIEYVAVTGAPVNSVPTKGKFASPCGRCRQRLYEHANDRTVIFGYDGVSHVRVYIMQDYLPNVFKPYKDK